MGNLISNVQDRFKTSSNAMAQVATFAFAGIEAIPVEVQVQLSSGAPNFQTRRRLCPNRKWHQGRDLPDPSPSEYNVG